MAVLPSCITSYVISVRQTRDLPAGFLFPTSGFLQIPSHDRHPCLRLYPSRYRADSGLSPVRNMRRQAHHKKSTDIIWYDVRTLFTFAAVLLKIPFPGNPSCPAGYDYACFGRVTVISVPESTSLVSFSVPPRKATPCFTIESPRPVPPISLE